MIHEVDESLRRLLTEYGLAEGGVELVFDAPTKDWATRRNAPTISVFLYDIREDVTRRRTGSIEEYDADGTVTGWHTPPRWFELTYLVTAWTNRPEDEHRLLSTLLRCFTRADAMPARLLTGGLAELGLTVTLDTAGRRGSGPSSSELWSALGGELKPAIDLRVVAPLAGEHVPAGPPVTEGLVVRVGDGVDEPDTGAGRRLRYEGATDPGATGFATWRERRPARRRRRGGSPR